MEQKELWDEVYRRNPRAWRGTSSIPVPCRGRALDVGCGNGKTVSALVEAGMEVTGVDFSTEAIGRCRVAYPKAEFVECDASSLPFPDGSFDLVTAVHVLENLEDGRLEEAASEIGRVLAPGGYLFVRCFTPDDMRSGDSRNGIFYRYYRPEDVLELFAGMDVVSSERKDEPTRFGTVRSRAECLFRKRSRTDGRQERRGSEQQASPDGRPHGVGRHMRPYLQDEVPKLVGGRPDVVLRHYG